MHFQEEPPILHKSRCVREEKGRGELRVLSFAAKPRQGRKPRYLEEYLADRPPKRREKEKHVNRQTSELKTKIPFLLREGGKKTRGEGGEFILDFLTRVRGVGRNNPKPLSRMIGRGQRTSRQSRETTCPSREKPFRGGRMLNHPLI